MTEIILCNRLSSLKSRLDGFSGSLRFLNLLETREGLRICQYLQERGEAIELPRAELFRERSAGFRTKFIEFMGRLNQDNLSRDWWAMPFTDRSPWSSALYQDIFHFHLIAELYGGNKGPDSDGPLVVLTDSSDLAAQVKDWAGREGVDTVDAVHGPQHLRRLLKRFTPAGIVYAALRVFWYWVVSRRLRPARNMMDDHLVITTMSHPRSFPDAGNGYSDVYFGELVDEAGESSSNAIVFALVLEEPLEQLKKLNSLESRLPVVPMDACLSVRDLAACILQSLKLFALPVRPKGRMEIDGLDMRCLVKRAIRATRDSGNLFMNLRIYYAVRGLARQIRIGRCLFPYENLARDKMIVLGVRDASPDAYLVGCQHASISQSFTNFALSEGEAKITPLPDVIMTTGEVSKEHLQTEGNYPIGIFKPACALRRSRLDDIEAKAAGNPITKVFAALGSINEYVGTLMFLEAAFAGEEDYELRIRPHPLRTLESAVAVAPLARQDFYSQSSDSLAVDLAWADVVLYSSSTVALEAISIGIPAIYLDLGNHVDTDPMWGWTGFKWPVKEPAELIPTIRSIEALPGNEFQERQEKGRAYIDAYMRPVTADGFSAFLGTTGDNNRSKSTWPS